MSLRENEESGNRKPDASPSDQHDKSSSYLEGEKMFTRRILTVLIIALLTFLSEYVLAQTSPNSLPDYPTGFESEPSEQPPRILNNPNRNHAQQDFQRFQMDMQRNMSPENNMARVNPEQRIRQMQKMAQEQEEQAMICLSIIPRLKPVVTRHLMKAKKSSMKSDKVKKVLVRQMWFLAN